MVQRHWSGKPTRLWKGSIGSVALAERSDFDKLRAHSVLPLRTRMLDFKGHRFEQDIILTSVRWYLAYPLSYRNLEEMLAGARVEVDHSTFTAGSGSSPAIGVAFRKGTNPVSKSWRMDETYINSNSLSR